MTLDLSKNLVDAMAKGEFGDGLMIQSPELTFEPVIRLLFQGSNSYKIKKKFRGSAGTHQFSNEYSI